jgi:small subunit ribosomal protein S20
VPNTKTAERAARESEYKKQRNRSTRSAVKTYIDRAADMIAAGDEEKAKQAVNEAFKHIDKAAKNNTIHENTASRRKANLMKKLNKAFGNQTLTATTKPKKVAKKTTAKQKSE